MIQEEYKDMPKSMVCGSPTIIECLECKQHSFAGVREQIKIRKQMLDDSLQKVIKPSRFTINRVRKMMNKSENHS